MLDTLPPVGNDSVAVQRHSAFSLLGLRFDATDVVETAGRIAAPLPERTGSARIYVTPNIQHIAAMRGNEELRRVMQLADLVTCDGFPLVSYARLSGCRTPGRITGREVVEQLLLRTGLGPDHTLFFLVDSSATAAAIARWKDEGNIEARVVTEVAPQCFGEDLAICAAVAERVRKAGTTILFLGLGAPKSELFASRYRTQLGGCWALCIGQGIKIALGLVPTPPRLVVRLRLEWAWRVLQEPRRLCGRYASSFIGFGAAVLRDIVWPARRDVLPLPYSSGKS